MAELIVNGGSIMYEDAVKKVVPDTDPQYYPTKRARAEINFTVEDGDEAAEAVIDQAVSLATRKVAEMLSGAHRSPSVTPAQYPAPAAPTEAPKRTRRTRAQIEADEAAKLAAPAADPFEESGGTPQEASQNGDAGTSDDPFAAGEPSDGGPQTSDEEWGAEAASPKEITDADLTAAVTKKNAEIKDAPAIRRTIGEFVKAPLGLKDIPQDQRQLFLNKLSALPKG